MNFQRSFNNPIPRKKSKEIKRIELLSKPFRYSFTTTEELFKNNKLALRQGIKRAPINA